MKNLHVLLICGLFSSCFLVEPPEVITEPTEPTPGSNFFYDFAFDNFLLVDGENVSLKSVEPTWLLAVEPFGLSYSTEDNVPGMSLNFRTGEISFDTLANFAAAAGRAITIKVEDSLGGGGSGFVYLKIRVKDKDELERLIALFIKDEGIGVNGNYNGIDTSEVEDMSTLFTTDGAGDRDIFASFNGNISKWDTSKVTDMSAMFSDAIAFNGDISEWNTSKVADMGNMFYRATAFKGDISKWNTSSVKNMGFMFFHASAFNGNISKWDTSKVTDMKNMFNGASSFNQDIGDWIVEKVTNMRNMFWNASSFNKDINSWNVEEVLDMSYIFNGASSFNKNINKWNVRAAKNYTWDSGDGSVNGLYKIFGNFVFSAEDYFDVFK